MSEMIIEKVTKIFKKLKQESYQKNKNLIKKERI
jgi:hypothetical protein